MKRILLLILIILNVLFFTACDTGNMENSIDLTSNSSSNYNSSSKSVSLYSNSSKSNSSSNNNYHICEASGCTKEGTKSYIGISGKTEYYCYEHYNEIMDIIGDMEDDVGNGKYSKHTCEVCSKEGTHSIIGISGNTEYYCTYHYYEMKDLLEKLYE